MSKDIIEDNIDINNIEISKDKQTIIMNEDNKKENKKNFKCKKQYIDEMGKYNSISTKFIPKYCYSSDREKNKYILLIRVEIPGNIQNLTASYIKYGKKKAIQIKGEKLKDNYEEMKKKSFIEIKDIRNYEEIRYLIDLQEEIEIYQETPIEKTEIYEFEFIEIILTQTIVNMMMKMMTMRKMKEKIKKMRKKINQLKLLLGYMPLNL